jgi:hypothetical protein
VATRSIFLFIVIMGVGALCSPTVAQTFQEIRVHWEASPGAPPETLLEPQHYHPAAAFTVVERRHRSGSLPRQRAPELSPDQLLIVAVDSQGREKERVLVPDPRVLRAELPGPTGELHGEVLHRATAEFLVPLPDDPTIVELRVYHPRWTGSTFDLDLLGTAPLR